MNILSECQILQQIKAVKTLLHYEQLSINSIINKGKQYIDLYVTNPDFTSRNQAVAIQVILFDLKDFPKILDDPDIFSFVEFCLDKEFLLNDQYPLATALSFSSNSLSIQLKKQALTRLQQQPQSTSQNSYSQLICVLNNLFTNGEVTPNDALNILLYAPPIVDTSKAIFNIVKFSLHDPLTCSTDLVVRNILKFAEVKETAPIQTIILLLNKFASYFVESEVLKLMVLNLFDTQLFDNFLTTSVAPYILRTEISSEEVASYVKSKWGALQLIQICSQRGEKYSQFDTIIGIYEMTSDLIKEAAAQWKAGLEVQQEDILLLAKYVQV